MSRHARPDPPIIYLNLVDGIGLGHKPERDPGCYTGLHRRLYGCDPEGWPDGHVHWSTSAQQWMRVNGYTDEPL